MKYTSVPSPRLPAMNVPSTSAGAVDKNGRKVSVAACRAPSKRICGGMITWVFSLLSLQWDEQGVLRDMLTMEYRILPTLEIGTAWRNIRGH